MAIDIKTKCKNLAIFTILWLKPLKITLKKKKSYRKKNSNLKNTKKKPKPNLEMIICIFHMSSNT